MERRANASENKALFKNYTASRFLLSTLCNARFRFHSPTEANFLPFSCLCACPFFLFNLFFPVAFQTFLLANALELENVSETFFTDEQNNYTRKKPYLSAQYIWIASNFLTQVAVKVSNIFTTIRREQTTRKT